MATTTTTSNDLQYTRRTQSTITATVSLTEADAGIDYNVATDALVITLPLIEADNLGMEFLIRNTGANGANIITLSPASADSINGRVSTAAADSVAGGVVNKDFVNTKATAKKGDYVRIKAVALTAWYISDGQGVWASEA